MKINQKALDKLKDIHTRKTGEELSDADVLKLGNRPPLAVKSGSV